MNFFRLGSQTGVPEVRECFSVKFNNFLIGGIDVWTVEFLIGLILPVEILRFIDELESFLTHFLDEFFVLELFLQFRVLISLFFFLSTTSCLDLAFHFFFLLLGFRLLLLAKSCHPLGFFLFFTCVGNLTQHSIGFPGVPNFFEDFSRFPIFFYGLIKLALFL